MPYPAFQLSCHGLVVRVRSEGGVRVVTLTGEADLLTEDLLGPAMRLALTGTRHAVVLDVSELSFCSAQALRVIADTASSTSHRGVGVAVVGLSRQAALMRRLNGLPAPPQHRSVQDAVAALAQHQRGAEGPRLAVAR